MRVVVLAIALVVAGTVPAWAGDSPWTVRVGIAHDSYAHTYPARGVDSPSINGVTIQVQYNFAPTFFLQVTAIVGFGNAPGYEGTNFLIFLGWEGHP